MNIDKRFETEIVKKYREEIDKSVLLLMGGHLEFLNVEQGLRMQTNLVQP